MSAPAATLKLQYPITWGDEVIETLEFRRMKAKDMRKLPDDDGGKTIILISRLTGHPPSVIDEMDAIDLAGAGEIVAVFLPKSPETGNRSSDGSLTE